MERGGETGDDVAVHHRRRRGGVRSERRRVAKLLSIFQPRKYRLPCSAHPFAAMSRSPSPSPAHIPPLVLSTHYANMRYQFDGDPRLFLSPILIARPVERLILAFACTFQCAKIRRWYIELNVFRFSRITAKVSREIDALHFKHEHCKRIKH